jgi:hypothetical protein
MEKQYKHKHITIKCQKQPKNANLKQKTYKNNAPKQGFFCGLFGQ